LKLTSILKTIVFIIFINNISLLAQKNDLSLFLEIGQANPGIEGFNVAGGGGGLGPWNNGIQFSFGVENPLYKKLSIRGMFNYSIHLYDEKGSAYLNHSNANFTHLDLLGDFKLNLGWFFLHGGIGLSSQTGDEIKFWDKERNECRNCYLPAKHKFLISGIFGIGLDINIYVRFNLLVESNLYFREYLGAAILGGVKYRLE
jgi:hypothetical protein